jgi:hypothetical protein
MSQPGHAALASLDQSGLLTKHRVLTPFTRSPAWRLEPRSHRRT